MMGPHKNLRVWQKAMELVSLVYKITANFPQHEVYGLSSQMRRSAVSIPSNIAEGYGRTSNADLIYFLHHSLGSSNELDTQILISQNLGYITEDEFRQIETLNDEVNKMLNALIYKRKQQQSPTENDLKT